MIALKNSEDIGLYLGMRIYAAITQVLQITRCLPLVNFFHTLCASAEMHCMLRLLIYNDDLNVRALAA